MNIPLDILYHNVLGDVVNNGLKNVPCGVSYPFLGLLVRRLNPKHVLELGTGCGRSGSWIMSYLPVESKFTTINWPNPPSGDDVGVELLGWASDSRLTRLLGDTHDPVVKTWVKGTVDLLFIDSGTTHSRAQIEPEWRLYAPTLEDGAVVCVDDIHFPGSDMEEWWDALPYEKLDTGSDLHVSGFGMFRYVR